MARGNPSPFKSTAPWGRPIQYVTGKRGGGHFPAPICDLADGNPLWSWCDVSDWLHRNGIVSAEALETSRIISAINCILEFQHQQEHGGPAFGEFRQLVEAVSTYL